MATAVWVGYPQGNVPMSNGFGGALAAPIWHDYMQAASSGYCGDFPPPTTPFQGTAYFGHYAVTGGSNTLPGSSAASRRQQRRRGATSTTPTTTRPCSPTRPSPARDGTATAMATARPERQRERERRRLLDRRRRRQEALSTVGALGGW